MLHKRWRAVTYVWIGIICSFVISGCMFRYAVRTKAHTMKRIKPFSLWTHTGRKVHYGKPWKKATVLVFLRGFW